MDNISDKAPFGWAVELDNVILLSSVSCFVHIGKFRSYLKVPDRYISRESHLNNRNKLSALKHANTCLYFV